ncbi:MAG: CNNM domain-containing protein, partial [Clostridiales bacterium]|nr:CNNM domain-containing protein [Clostridiales bacterium]
MGSGGILWPLLLQVTLISINAVFACAEIAIISINDRKLAKMAAEGNKKAARLLALVAQPARFLSVIQVGITLAGFLGSAFAADNFASLLTEFLIKVGVRVPVPTLNTISVITITLVLSYFTLVFGELVPKRVAMSHAETIGLSLSGLVFIISKIFSPIIWFLTLSTNAALRLVGIDPNANEEEVTEEEIRLMVDAGGEKGAIDHEEMEFIHNLFDFDDKPAEEIMTHRTEVSLLWLNDTIDEWGKTINEII